MQRNVWSPFSQLSIVRSLSTAKPKKELIIGIIKILIVTVLHLFVVRPGAIRKSSPVIVSSLVIMTTALGLSMLGNGSRDSDIRSLLAAVLYISSGNFSVNLFKECCPSDPPLSIKTFVLVGSVRPL